MDAGQIILHRGDLPAGTTLGPVVAVDTEAMGLNPHRDRLCLVQLSSGDGNAVLVQIIPGTPSPHLARMLADPAIVKLMHFARFDVALLQHHLGITVAPIRCTKIAAKLTPAQSAYAAADVLHLHALWARLDALLAREHRTELAEAAFAFLPARARLDLLGYDAPDLFAH